MPANETANRARSFMEALPFSKALGMQIDALEDGRAVISMPYDDKLIGDPRTGVIHGGVVSALMDTCGGAAVISHPLCAGATATIDLRIDYMRPARPGKRLVAEAHCYHVTRSVAFVRATAHDGDIDSPVAAVTGAFTFMRKDIPSGSGDAP